MYCERCGRPLQKGQICPCRKKHRKDKFDKKLIISILLLLAGITLACYFLLKPDNFLEYIPLKAVQNIKNYLYCALPAVLFLLGVILGCFALRKRKTKKIPRFAVIGNFLGIIFMAGMAGWTGIQEFQIEQLISQELTTETKSKILDVYNDPNTDSGTKDRIIRKLTSEVDKIGDDYNKEKITYAEAEERLQDLASLSIIRDETDEKERELNILKTSKDNFKKAEELESDSKTAVEAMQLYGEVVQEDENYGQAQKKYKDLGEQFKSLAKAGNYTDNIDILSSFYQIADPDEKISMEEKASEQAEQIKQEYIKENLTYEEANAQLSDLQKIVGVIENIEEEKTSVERLYNSREAYMRAEELAENEATMSDAVKAYQEVIKEDPNYKTAQDKATQIISSLAENCINVAKTLVESKDYRGALQQIGDGLSLLPENEDLLSLKDQYQKEYVEYALQEADRLLTEKNLEEAETVLSAAYQDTNDPEIAEKLSTIGNYQPVSLCDLASIDSHDVWVEEEQVTDSYGNTYTNVYALNVGKAARAVYRLDGQYERFSGKLVVSDETDSNAEMSLAIFADDVLIYSVTGYTRQTGEQLIDIDLTGVQKLEIQTQLTGGYSNDVNNLLLVDAVFEKSVNPSEPKKLYERLRDTIMIDSGNAEISYNLLADSYGKLHNGSLNLDADYDGYALFNLDGKYANFSGEIVTGSETGSGASISVQIYLDDVLIFEQNGIEKTMNSIPFSLNVANGKVLKIVTAEAEVHIIHGAFCYIVDDKLYFEQPSEEQIENTASTANASGSESETTSESAVSTETEASAVSVPDTLSIAAGGDESNDASTDIIASQSTPTLSETGAYASDTISFNGHTYAMYDMDDVGVNSYSEMKAFCEERGGYLAVINSYEENQAIYQYILSKGKKMAFFGYSDENSEGNWEWARDQGNTYTNWAEGQPNNGANNTNGEGEDYAHFKQDGNGTWNDAPFGSNTSNFICEWDSAVSGDTSFYNDGTVVLPNSYILPESAQRDLTEEDVRRLTHKGIRYAINEIYARHGYIFQLQETAAYFGAQSWYDGGDTSDMETVVSRMNEYERRNNEYLARMEIEIYGSEYNIQ